MGHLLLILIIQLATIQRLNEGKFYCDYSSNEPYDIEGDYAIDKNVFKKNSIIVLYCILLCVQEMGMQHRDRPVMNYFSDGITKQHLWDALLDVCDMYF